MRDAAPPDPAHKGSLKTIVRFLPMLWPKGELELKARVVVAVLLVLLGKATTLLMPFAYKGDHRSDEQPGCGAVDRARVR